MNKSGSVVLFALFSNIFLTLGKFIVAIISGSAGLMAEFFHSSSDTLNQLLLLLGIKKSTEKDRLNFPFGKGKEQYFWSFIASIMDIRDSILLNAFMEDLGALIGVVIISTGFLFSLLYHNSLFDAISSIGVGILLIIIGIYLAGINKDLLLGKGLTSRDREKIIRIIKETKNVNGIVNMDGIYMGPSSIIIGLDLNFKDGLTTEEIENTIDTIEKRIRAEIPYVRRIYIEAEEVRKSI